MRMWLLIAQQGGAFDGALQGAMIGGIAGALVWLGLRVSQMIQ